MNKTDNKTWNGYIKTLNFRINPHSNGGEAIILNVDLFDNGDGVVFTNTSLTLHCYGTFTVKLDISEGFEELTNAFLSVKEEITNYENLKKTEGGRK